VSTKQLQAVLVERNGEPIGAAFPDYSLVIVRVPYHDPDRDGMTNGQTHEIQVDFTGKPIESVGRGSSGRFSGQQGSPVYLAQLLRRAVDGFNAKCGGGK